MKRKLSRWLWIDLSRFRSLYYSLNNPKFSDRHVWANKVNSDQSDQILHCLPFRLHFWTHFNMVKYCSRFQNDHISFRVWSYQFSGMIISIFGYGHINFRVWSYQFSGMHTSVNQVNTLDYSLLLLLLLLFSVTLLGFLFLIMLLYMNTSTTTGTTVTAIG